MRCVEFSTRWNELLDLRESPEADSRLSDHLESCPACRASHVGFEMVCEILRDQPLADLPWAELNDAGFSPSSECDQSTDSDEFAERDGLAERVLAELAAPRPAGRSAAWYRGLAVRVGASGVAAATLLALYLSSGEQANLSSPPAVVAIHSASPKAAEPAVAVAPQDITPAEVATAHVATAHVATGDVQLVSLAGGTRVPDGLGRQFNFGGQALAHGIGAMSHGFDAVGAVARDTSQELATAVRRIPNAAIELAGTNTPTDLAAASEPFLNVSQSLRPVAASMSETWEILKRAMPTGEPGRG